MSERNIKTKIVVEDDTAHELLLRMYIGEERYKIQEADSGCSTQHLTENHPDFRIVISDLEMPESGDFDLFRTIRDRFEKISRSQCF
ncbi:response regulator [Desulfomarina sp.]